MDRRGFLKILGVTAGATAIMSDSAWSAVTDSASTQTVSGSTPPNGPGKKILIAHRGASAYAPENTLDAYRLAITQGADLVEQDLQITKDNVLICMHDSVLETTTNADDVFPDRFTLVTEKGKKVKHWPIHDFTLAEIKQLKSRSRSGKDFPSTTVPTWQEAIDTISGKAGLCPETKGPEGYRKLGFDMEKLVYATLKKNGLTKSGWHAKTPVFMQSFSQEGLLRLQGMGIELPTLWLSSTRTTWTPEKLADAKKHFSAIGPWKGKVTAKSVKQAHAAGLLVIPFTYSADGVERHFKGDAPAPHFKNVTAEMSYDLYEEDIDGLFTNNPDMFPRKPVTAKS